VLPSTVRRDTPRIDVLGAVLVTGGLLLALFALVDGPQQGSTSWSTVLGAGLALVQLAALAVRQARERTPLVPRALLRSRTVRLGVGGVVGAAIGAGRREPQAGRPPRAGAVPASPTNCPRLR
jgi:hypothetical protein